jgi:phosphate-selective porin OprO/OprP
MRKQIIKTTIALGLVSWAQAEELSMIDISTESVASSSATGLLLGKLTGETTMDRMWSAFTLYKNDNNPILQEFAVQGRLQLQGADGHADTGHFDASQRNDESMWGDDLDIRRARLGFKSKWLNNYKLEGQIDIDPNLQPDLYHGIYDLYLTYAPSDTFNLSVGKTKVKFSREQEISSKEIITIERGMLSNMLFPGELTGVWTSGKGIGENWLYEAGFYGNERNQEFTDRDGGLIFLGKVGYDYSTALGLDSAVASVHYMHNTEPNFQGNHTSTASTTRLKSPNFSDSFAITNDISQGRFGLVTEALFADGQGSQSDVMGFTIIPSYYIYDGVQLVGRFQVATSDDANDLTLPSRYEGLAPSMGDKKGDSYMSTYLGLSYYIYGHKLKLMGGIEYSTLEGNTSGGDYDGYTAMGGLRFSF